MSIATEYSIFLADKQIILEPLRRNEPLFPQIKKLTFFMPTGFIVFVIRENSLVWGAEENSSRGIKTRNKFQNC